MRRCQVLFSISDKIFLPFRRTAEKHQKSKLDTVLQGVQTDARAHGGGDGSALEVGTLCCSGLCLGNSLHHSVQVGVQLLCTERSLAHGHMDDVLLVQTVLDLTSLGLGNSLAQVGSNGTSLGVGHQAAGAQDLTETANAAHHVGGGDDNVEVHEAAGDLCDQLVITDDVSAGCLSSSGGSALSDGADADGLAGAVGQNDSAADLLVSVTAVNAQTDVQLNSQMTQAILDKLDDTELPVLVKTLDALSEFFTGYSENKES